MSDNTLFPPLQAARVFRGRDPFQEPDWGVPFKATTLRRVSFKAEMLSFSIILDHSKPAAAQTTKWSVLVLLFDYFAPKAAQMVHRVPCGHYFGPKATLMF